MQEESPGAASRSPAPLACRTLLERSGKWMMEIRCQLFTDHIQRHWSCLPISQLINCVLNIWYLVQEQQNYMQMMMAFYFLLSKNHWYVFSHRNLIKCFR